MICSISGEFATEPVVSKLSGHIYESRLIRKAIRDNGKDPITGQTLHEDDLIAVQVAKVVQPRLVTNTSIPGILSSLQNEWDDLMFETFQLKQALDQTRQELAQALYQHDAACRVIARLMRERDEAQAQLQNMSILPPSTSSSQHDGQHSQAMDVVEPSSHHNDGEQNQAKLLPEEILADMNEKCKILSSGRKNRKPSPSLSTKEAISSFTTTATFTPYPKSSAKAGHSITCIALSHDDTQQHMLIGGGEKEAMLLDRHTGKVLNKLTGHHKKIHDICFHPDAAADTCYTASADHSVKVWKAISNGKQMISSSLAGHDDEVSSIAVHPTGDYLLSGAYDGYWKLWNLNTSVIVRSIAYDASIGKNAAITKVRLHPDGLILATGTSNQQMKLWDLREQASVALLDHHAANITSISFNENGYLCATASDDHMIRIWDLRKLKSVKDMMSSGVSSAVFDGSGSYLAYNRHDSDNNIYDVHVCVVKEYDHDLLSSSSLCHGKDIHALAWGHDASYLVSAGADRNVKVHQQAL